jgi:hypothetical protein
VVQHGGTWWLGVAHSLAPQPCSDECRLLEASCHQVPPCCTCLVVKLRRRAQQLEPAGPHRWQYLLIVRVGFAADCHKVLCARDEPRAGTAWAKRGVHWPERISGVRPERALRRLGCAGWAPDELFLYLPISNALRRFTFEYSF